MHPERSLADAIDYVLANRYEGVTCPCCTQSAKVYRRRINAPVAAWLIALRMPR